MGVAMNPYDVIKSAEDSLDADSNLREDDHNNTYILRSIAYSLLAIAKILHDKGSL
jgi:hypothetical protein